MQELGNLLEQIASTDVMPVESPGSIDSYDDEDDSSSRHSMGTPSGRGLKRTRARTIDKKQSNKVAAVKYRNKKLKERDELFAECEKYATRNTQLRKMIEETQTEISFIKSLLVEALIARNKSWTELELTSFFRVYLDLLISKKQFRWKINSIVQYF